MISSAGSTTGGDLTTNDNDKTKTNNSTNRTSTATEHALDENDLHDTEDAIYSSTRADLIQAFVDPTHVVPFTMLCRLHLRHGAQGSIPISEK